MSKGFGELEFVFTDTDFRLDQPAGAGNEWLDKFREDRFAALYEAGFEERPDSVTPSAGFLYLVASGFLSCLTSKAEIELARERTDVSPDGDTVEMLLSSIPYAIGTEYITEKWIKGIFKGLKEQFAREIKEYEGTVAMYIAEKSQHLRVPERIYFHLVEQKDEDFPFAFMATYATTGERNKIKHMPLKYALTEFKSDHARLLNLLSCLNRAADVSPLISSFVTSGEMFHPLRLTPQEAWEFLKDVEKIEETGILCRIPNWWRKKSGVPSVSIKLGEEQPSLLGFKTLISLRPQLVVDGVVLTREDIRYLLEQSEGLALLKGKWVEVNHAKLRALLEQIDKYPETVTLKEALQMGLDKPAVDADVGALITNGKWLSEFLGKLRSPQKLRSTKLPEGLNATLRPYQKTGYTWLDYMDSIGFGACIADDMGLGKTVQVLAYLEKVREEKPESQVLLIVPASLIGNWQKEIEKFTPGMDYMVLHGAPSDALSGMLRSSGAFLTITTYGMAARIMELQKRKWYCVILDEAQNIKNPGTKQTREIKKIESDKRIVMTGTPIENDLTNLWSIFDFLNKGLLGTSQEFSKFCKGLSANPLGYGKLKSMISPFILRRLKTDKRIIADLPDKVESVDYVSLSRKQVVLYHKVTDDLAAVMESGLDGIQRKGMVLAAISKLKQICNHPDQYLGQQAFEESESGKMQMLREICETIYEKRERVIVFTQFREITEYLSDFLKGIFGREGFVLHGGTPVKKRTQMVEEFQSDEYIPYMVISLKAGGTGLNLTKANHVIHFDRWWNPAVENQATDRTYRIGQQKTVIVHKLVCRGTIEEKIDELINSKTELAENVIGSGGEQWLTELSNDELMSMLRLDA
ncbi:MAG: DEAD/DEAH box helicase [Clostridia bacterium]|nr:DEAD/DEAH box helicase [Clostridia bacterium]